MTNHQSSTFANACRPASADKPINDYRSPITCYTPPMPVTRSTLKLFALLTWITGGVVLFLKGYALFAQALELRPGAALNYAPFLIAITVGGLKARYLFLPSCRKNLARIEDLIDPRPWQFFRVGFFIFLITMISLGAWLSRWAEGNYAALLTVSSVDLTLSVGLVGSLGGFSAKGGGRRAQERHGNGETGKRRTGEKP